MSAIARLTDMTWPGVAAYLERRKSVIVPLGACEQHGPGLPLGADSLIGQALADAVGEATGALTAPMLSPGMSLHTHPNFPGTISLKPATFAAVIRETLESLYGHGFRVFLLVNGHGGNDGPLADATNELAARLKGLFYAQVNWFTLPQVDAAVREALGRPVAHGGAAEASMVKLFAPELVREDRLCADFNEAPFKTSNDLAGAYRTVSGVIGGNGRDWSLELAERVRDLAVAHCVSLLEAMERAQGQA